MSKGLYRTFKQGIAVMCTLSAAWFGTTVSAYAASSPAKSTGSFVALGDSITFGYNLQDTNGNTVPSEFAFPQLIGQANHLSVSDLAVPGWTTNDLLHALQTPDYIRAVRNASAISLDIGSNDLIHIAENEGLLSQAASTTPVSPTEAEKQAFATGIAQITKNIGTIVSDIRSQTKAPILLYNLYNPFPDASGIHAAGELFQSAVNQGIGQVANSTKNVFVVDAHKGFDHNQLTFVQVSKGDIHPTILGQEELAKLGDEALTQEVSTLKTRSNVITAEMAGYMTPEGGTISAKLLDSTDTLTLPQSALGTASEVSATSTALSGLSSIVPGNEKVVAEGSVHFMEGVTLSKPYTLTIKNQGITSGSAVYQVTGNKFSLVPSAKVRSGQAVIPSVTEGDFVVVEPTVSAVAGATMPETGFPALTDAAIAFVLIGLGGGLIYGSCRKREM